MKETYLFTLAMAFLTTPYEQEKGEGTVLVRPVRTAIVSSQSAIPRDFSGIVEAMGYVRLAFRINGQTINLPVAEGQRVKKGQLIAAIDPRDTPLQYAADKAVYEAATAQAEYSKWLLGHWVISLQEYEINVANYQKAKSACELSTNNVWDTKLLAPLDGSIETRLVENYQRVSSGEGIVRLIGTRKLRIKFTVPDNYLYLLCAKDATFRAEFDTYKGTVPNARLEEYLDISTGSAGIPVTIIIDDAAFNRTIYDVKPGFTCNIRLALGIAPFIEEKLMNVPLSAMSGNSENKNTYVRITKDDKVNYYEVIAHSPTGGVDFLVSKGLKPGETVIIAGVYQLMGEQRIKEAK